MKKNNLIAGAGMALFLAALAHADNDSGARTEKVRYTEWEVTSNPAVVYRRLKYAAANVCSSLDWNGPLWRQQVHADCVRLAIKDAVAQINRPVFSDYVQAVDSQTRVRLANKR